MKFDLAAEVQCARVRIVVYAFGRAVSLLEFEFRLAIGGGLAGVAREADAGRVNGHDAAPGLVRNGLVDRGGVTAGRLTHRDNDVAIGIKCLRRNIELRSFAADQIEFIPVFVE